MDGKLVSSSLSVSEGGEQTKARSPFSTYTEQFYEHFPYYLSIGMTYEQYWNGDPMLVKYFRQADEMKYERKNQELWLQGMYVYYALGAVMPVAKGHEQPKYPDKPFSLTDKQRKKDKLAEEKAKFEKGKMMMEMFMSRSNKQFKDKSS